jgi:hypothetical protein
MTRWYQVIYSGKFKKGSIDFSVSPDQINQWSSDIKDMLLSGVKVPVPIEHNFLPTARVGTVVDSAVKVDSKGREGLYLLAAFENEKDFTRHEKTGVSVFIGDEPYSLPDMSKTWSRPIIHMALTDYPVMGTMDVGLALSQVPSGLEEKTMVEFTAEQWLVLTTLLGLSAEATPEEFVAAMESIEWADSLDEVEERVPEGTPLSTPPSEEVATLRKAVLQGLALSVDSMKSLVPLAGTMSPDQFQQLVKGLQLSATKKQGTGSQTLTKPDEVVPPKNYLLADSESRFK